VIQQLGIGYAPVRTRSVNLTHPQRPALDRSLSKKTKRTERWY